MTSLSEERTRKKIARLRARGMTFQAIADKFGVTRQAVHFALNRIPRPAEIRCSRCKRTIRRQENWLHNVPVLCVRCIDRRPTTFAARLRALRVDAGLTAKELGKRAGVAAATTSRRTG
jgi:DNA-binding XRE family transcriptional regulator